MDWRNIHCGTTILDSVPVYRIKDYNGEDIKGTFYQSELQKITVRDTD